MMESGLELNFLLSEKEYFSVIYPLLFAGTKTSDLQGYEIIEEENSDASLKEITSITSIICRRVEAGSKVFFRFKRKSKSAFPTLSCVIRRVTKRNPKESVNYIKTIALSAAAMAPWTPTKDQIWMVENYRPPIKVLFCGDRNNAICFENTITFELKALPEDSIVIHGGCKGVDLFTEELAKHLGIATRIFSVTPEEWNRIGLSAGPQRNQKMLDDGEGPPLAYVMAFHVDISMSKGTKDMMNRAWRQGFPVYIHDLKRKSKFEGDFTVL